MKQNFNLTPITTTLITFGALSGVADAASLMWDFSSSDHGFTAAQDKLAAAPNDASPFIYSGSDWRVDGGAAGSNPGWIASSLFSPVVVADGSDLVISFDHSFNYELDWDSAQLLVTLNGGSQQLVGVDIGSFSEGGYTQVITSGATPGLTPHTGQLAWTGISPGITSSANLGAVTAGTTAQFEFRGNWDPFFSEPNPAWTITSVTTQGVVPEPSSAILAGLAALGLVARRRRTL